MTNTPLLAWTGGIPGNPPPVIDNENGVYEFKFWQPYLWLQPAAGTLDENVPGNASGVNLSYEGVGDPDEGIGATLSGEVVVRSYTGPGEYEGTAVVQLRMPAIGLPGTPMKYKYVRQEIPWKVTILGENDKERASGMIFDVKEIPLPGLEATSVPLRKGPHSFSGWKHKHLFPPKPGLARSSTNPAQPANPPAGWDDREEHRGRPSRLE